MIFDLKEYNWICNVYLLDFEDNIKSIVDNLKKIDCNYDIIKSSILNISNKNSGFCYSNLNERETVLAIGKTDSTSQFLNSFYHEVCHFAIHIANADKINRDEEYFCYLLGEVASELSSAILKVCDIKK